MHMKVANVVAIGHFPPPVNGLSYVTDTIVSRLSCVASVQRMNISPTNNSRRLTGHFLRLWRVILACWGLLARTSRLQRNVCYTTLDGGFGQIYTLLIVIVARLCNYKLYLHHHSFGYINKYFWLTHAVTIIARDAEHVFLCPLMRDTFQDLYGCQSSSRVISNASIIPSSSVTVEQQSGNGFVIGMLGNLNLEKGLYIFLDLMRRLYLDGNKITGVLAGPIQLSSDKLAVEDFLRRYPNCIKYVGPVYGADKDLFFRGVDVIVFPTQYQHEAEPLVIYEAQSYGCRIASYERGCIRSQLSNADLIVASSADFVDEVVKWVSCDFEGEGRSERAVSYGIRQSGDFGRLNDFCTDIVFGPGSGEVK